MKTAYFLIGFFLFCSSFITAQEETPENNYEKMFLLNGSIHLGFPLNNFRDNISRAAVGGGGSFLVMINKKLPLYTGLELAGMIHDSESENYILFDGDEEYEAKFTTRTSIFTGHGVIRVMPPTNFYIIPYFDGMIGFKNFYARTEIKDEDLDESIDSYIEDGDWVMSYGGAIGIQIPPIKWQDDEFLLLLDLKCAWLSSPAADYHVRINDLSGVNVEEPIDVFEIKNSTTDMIIAQIGLTFFF